MSDPRTRAEALLDRLGRTTGYFTYTAHNPPPSLEELGNAIRDLLAEPETTRLRAIIAAQEEVIWAEREGWEAFQNNRISFEECLRRGAHAAEARAALARLLADGESPC